MKSLWIVVLLMSSVCGAQDVTCSNLSDKSTCVEAKRPAIVFNRSDTKILFSVDSKTAKITLSEGVGLDEASAAFWKYVRNDNPVELQQRIKELEAENAKLRKQLEPTKVKTLPPGRVINGVIEMHVERMGVKHVCTELIDGTLQCPNGFRTKFYNPEVWQSLCTWKP